MRVFHFLLAAVVSVLLGAPAAGALMDVAQVDFADGRVVGSTPSGWNRVTEPGGANAITSVDPLKRPDGSNSTISLTMTNHWGWGAQQGPNTSLTALNGVVFPAAAVLQFVGDNEASGRNNHAVIRLASVEKYFYELTFASANTHSLAVDTLVNVGGTWDNSGKMFVGGETVTLNTASPYTSAGNTGFLSGWSTWDSSDAKYVLDLQVGNPSGGSSVAGLNALHIRAIPEPASGVLALLGVVLLLGWRRRR